MSPDLPPKVYVTHEFFLSFSENLNIFLKPYTQEEWLKFSLLNSWHLKWCLKHTWWVNFSKYVHDWDQDSPLLSTYVKRKVLDSILLKTFDTSGLNSPPSQVKFKFPNPLHRCSQMPVSYQGGRGGRADIEVSTWSAHNVMNECSVRCQFCLEKSVLSK